MNVCKRCGIDGTDGTARTIVICRTRAFSSEWRVTDYKGSLSHRMEWQYIRVGQRTYWLCKPCQWQIFRQAFFTGLIPLLLGTVVGVGVSIGSLASMSKVPYGTPRILLFILALAAFGVFLVAFSRLIKQTLRSKSEVCDYALQTMCRDEIGKEFGAAEVLTQGAIGGAAGQLVLLRENEAKSPGKW